MSLITFLSLPLCPVYNNGSYFTPDNGDRRLPDAVYTIQPVVNPVEQPVVSWKLGITNTFAFTSSRGDVHWTAPSWVNVIATAVGHRRLHTGYIAWYWSCSRTGAGMQTWQNEAVGFMRGVGLRCWFDRRHGARHGRRTTVRRTDSRTHSVLHSASNQHARRQQSAVNYSCDAHISHPESLSRQENIVILYHSQLLTQQVSKLCTNTVELCFLRPTRVHNQTANRSVHPFMGDRL